MALQIVLPLVIKTSVGLPRVADQFVETDKVFIFILGLNEGCLSFSEHFVCTLVHSFRSLDDNRGDLGDSRNVLKRGVEGIIENERWKGW